MRESSILKRILIVFSLNLIGFGNSFAGLEPGTKAPDFKLPLLADGKEVSLKDFQGKVVIIHLWKCT